MAVFCCAVRFTKKIKTKASLVEIQTKELCNAVISQFKNIRNVIVLHKDQCIKLVEIWHLANLW